MNKRQPKRVTRELTDVEEDRLARNREQVRQELPDLMAKDQMRKDARSENTLSGELRRAIHTSEISLTEISNKAGVTPILLDEFLTGEKPLPSDILDRLAGLLGYELRSAG